MYSPEYSCTGNGSFPLGTYVMFETGICLWLCSWAVTESYSSQSIMSLQPVVSGENCSEGKIKGVYSPCSSVGRLYCKDLHDCIVMYVTAGVVLGSFDIPRCIRIHPFFKIWNIIYFKINDVTSARQHFNKVLEMKVKIFH